MIKVLILLLFSITAYADVEYSENVYRKFSIHRDRYHHEYMTITTNGETVRYSVVPIVVRNQPLDTLLITREDYKHLYEEFFGERSAY
jgi:hypothetical protein